MEEPVAFRISGITKNMIEQSYAVPAALDCFFLEGTMAVGPASCDHCPAEVGEGGGCNSAQALECPNRLPSLADAGDPHLDGFVEDEDH